jgi:hypothetical protein
MSRLPAQTLHPGYAPSVDCSFWVFVNDNAILYIRREDNNWLERPLNALVAVRAFFHSLIGMDGGREPRQQERLDDALVPRHCKVYASLPHEMIGELTIGLLCIPSSAKRRNFHGSLRHNPS